MSNTQSWYLFRIIRSIRLIRSIFFISACALLLDRFLKAYAQGLPEGTAFLFFPGLEFGYFLNPALFFFPAWRFIPWLALFVLLGVSGFVIWKFLENYKLKIENSQYLILLPIVLGGVSNVFDRFAYGGVIDYVNIFGLATINLADILILTGLLIILIRHF